MNREWKIQRDEHGYFAVLVNRMNGESIIRSRSYPARTDVEKEMSMMSGSGVPGQHDDRNGDGGD